MDQPRARASPTPSETLSQELMPDRDPIVETILNALLSKYNILQLLAVISPRDDQQYMTQEDWVSSTPARKMQMIDSSKGEVLASMIRWHKLRFVFAMERCRGVSGFTEEHFVFPTPFERRAFAVYLKEDEANFCCQHFSCCQSSSPQFQSSHVYLF